MENDDMTSMPCLIMQYKPYIVEQSCMGALRSFCMFKKTADTHEYQCMFIQSRSYCTHTLKELTKVCNVIMLFHNC